MPKRNVLLGDFLIEQGLITEDQLRQALRHQKQTAKLLGRSLIDLGFLDEKAMIKALSEQIGVQYVSLKNYRVDPAVVKLIPEHVARTFQVFPLFVIDQTLTVGMVNPLDIVAIDAVSRETGLKVEPVVCTQVDILEAIDHWYRPAALKEAVRTLGEAASKEQPAEDPTDEQRLRREAEEGPIIKLVNLILTEAVQQGASDIHLEPRERDLKVRYRIDGVLQEAYDPPKNVQLAITSRIKILAGLNIAERRLPQDGRFTMTIDRSDVDFRVSTLPTAHGESVVLRVLDDSRVMLQLDELGFSPASLSQLKSLLARPHGMLFVTGPTGSGKTTTLYAALRLLNTGEKNLTTVEDPIEYQLEGVRQVQVNPKIGLTFATGLRAILRQDPDIIMVGEIRDLETAQIAVQSALTGHLVLSTLHTNDAASTLIRLEDMGVETYLVAAAAEGVVAQRLVRKLCPKCKEGYQPGEGLRKTLGLPGAPTLYRAKGCKDCRYTGYRGRVGIYEILILDDDIRELILRRASPAEIRRAAQPKGMKTLREDGLEKAVQGITSVEEVMRVTELG